MRYILLSCLIVLIPTFDCSGQDTLTYYFDNLGNQTDEEDFSVKRFVIQKENSKDVVEYYQNKTLKCRYSLLSDNVIDGYFQSYYLNGKKNKEGLYSHGYKIGNWKTWYEEGGIKAIENFISDSNTIRTIRINGLSALNQYRTDVLIYFSVVKGIYLDTSRWFNKDGTMAQEEIWNNGLRSVTVFSHGVSKKFKVNEDNWKTHITKEPEYKGNLRKLIKQHNLKMPKNITTSQLAYTEFTIDKNLKISNIEVKRVSHLNDSLLFIKHKALIMASEKDWVIGTIHNLPASYKVRLPIVGNIGNHSGWGVKTSFGFEED